MAESSNVQKEGESIPMRAEGMQLDARNVQKILIRNRLKQMSRTGKAVWILGILILLSGAGFGLYKWLGSGSSIQYLTMTVSQGSITDSIEATGTLEPVKKSEMGFKNDGTIIALNVQPGDKVVAGQVLAQQDSTTLTSALQQAQSSLVQDQISLQSAALNHETNLKTLARQKTLFEAGAISQSDLDDAQNAADKSELELATARAKLVNDQAKLAEAQSDLDGATLTAPFDGIIGAVNGQVGQINGINSSSSTLLTVMSEDLQLSALVNEADIGRIKIGQDVEFTSSAYSDKTFKGKVLRITPEAETVSNVQYYPVLISVIDPERQLKSGMSVSADIIVAQKSDVLTVPMMAVSYGQNYIKTNLAGASNASGQNSASTSSAGISSGKQGVVVVKQNDQLLVRNVVLGLSDGTNYEVIEGLNEGDSVVVGTNSTANSTSSSSSSSSSKSSSSRSSQGGAGMGGPPPGGF